MDNNIENYKGYTIEFIDYRGDYRVYDPVYPQQTIAYEDSIESAKMGIDEQLTPKKLISIESNGRTDRFAVVDSFPDSSYRIWNIGDNMLDGYLPLCRLSDSIEIDTNSLVAIDMSDKPEILHMLRQAANIGINSLETAQNCSLLPKPHSDFEKEQYKTAIQLLSVFEELSPFASRDIENYYKYLGTTDNKSNRLSRLDVPENVKNDVLDYLEEHFKDQFGTSKYELAYIGRASDHPEDHYLYQVVARNISNGIYDCWTSWNQSTKSLNHGHYGFYDFVEAKSVLNDLYFITNYQGKHLEVPKEVLDAMSFEDNLVDYLHDEFGSSFMENYQEISKNKDLGTDMGIAYTTISDEEIPIQVSLNLSEKIFYTEIAGVIYDYSQFDSFSDMAKAVPLNFDELTCADEYDADFCITGDLLADCFKMLTEGDRPAGNNFFEKLHNYSSAQEIYQRPADIARVIDDVAAKDPSVKPLCDKFKEIVDGYIEIKEKEVPYGFFDKAKDLFDKCQKHLGIEPDLKHQDKGESR